MVKFDIRDLICDGYGFTAEQSGMNRLKAKCVRKINDKFKLKKVHHQQKDEKDEREISKGP